MSTGQSEKKTLHDLRDVRFSDVESFFNELAFAVEASEDDRPDCVRMDIETDDTMDGMVRYGVRAGFTQQGFLRELFLDCGADYQGCGEEAKHRAEQVAKRIAEFVASLGVRVAGGTYRSSWS